MKNKFILFIAVLFAMVACDPSDFDDTNVDPRQVKEAPTRTLLTFALQQLPFTVWNAPIRNVAGYGTEYLDLYAQHLAEGPYPASSLYSVRNLSWTAWYTGPLYNLQTIINLNNEDSKLADIGNGSKNNQIAVARIMKAYYFWFLTDIYGDIPYSDALKGNQVLQPKYDKQEDIYNDLFKELKEAQAMINTGEAGVTGDILLGGDMAAWKRFANTTRLFMSLRLMKKNPAKAQTEMTAALTDGVIESNAQNITYKFIGGDPNNWNPWYENYSNDNRNDYAISSTLGNYMLANNDPRVFVYGEVLNGSEVKPLPYGSSAAKNIPGIYSRIGARLQASDTEAPIFTYAQVQFVKAEAVHRGFTIPNGGAVADLYNSAIKASWEFWGVYDEAAYNAFIADADIAYTTANGLEKIISQKWVHQYLNGFESWTDWRRTGFPVLAPAPDAVDSRGIPRRMGYPSNAKALNEAGYTEAVTRQGADDNYTRVWWDAQ
ncbi:SusD/RagB family nutrient-binding outer membrane lipoprotein [Pontibacter vulgaris]|uniref:SusD/RagB family nutrient-binding outer membrane lipoprotein n=1 Tax=Pontibacter vulgaris TaxID=2905679 RepID=UPI001FA6BE9F|nr:SusD/RagB family nutrient-binding outer membrane lipoprotein [Pontibacter vulgaris]